MSWHLEARFHALGSRPSAGMAQGYFNHGLCSYCVLCLREEPGNPKPWTNLVTPHSYRSHGPSEFSVLLSLSVVPPGPGSGVSDRLQSEQAGNGERSNLGPILPSESLVRRLRCP